MPTVMSFPTPLICPCGDVIIQLQRAESHTDDITCCCCSCCWKPIFSFGGFSCNAEGRSHTDVELMLQFAYEISANRHINIHVILKHPQSSTPTIQNTELNTARAPLVGLWKRTPFKIIAIILYFFAFTFHLKFLCRMSPRYFGKSLLLQCLKWLWNDYCGDY